MYEHGLSLCLWCRNIIQSRNARPSSSRYTSIQKQIFSHPYQQARSLHPPKLGLFVFCFSFTSFFRIQAKFPVQYNACQLLSIDRIVNNIYSKRWTLLNVSESLQSESKQVWSLIFALGHTYNKFRSRYFILKSPLNKHLLCRTSSSDNPINSLESSMKPNLCFALCIAAIVCDKNTCVPLKCCFTSTETVGLLGKESPWRPRRLFTHLMYSDLCVLLLNVLGCRLTY